jgi:hypothetical protein
LQTASCRDLRLVEVPLNGCGELRRNDLTHFMGAGNALDEWVPAQQERQAEAEELVDG